MSGRPRRKSAPLHDRRLFHARLRCEALEDRCLLSMGDLLQTLADPSTLPQGFSYFGSAVAVDSPYTVVGSTGADSQGIRESGCACVFNTSTGALVATLKNPTPAVDDRFGYSVAVSGNTIVVGAIYDDTGATNAGSAYVFDAATGNLLCTLNNPTPADGDYFGYSVAVSGSTVVVGAIYDDTGDFNAGSAYVFDAITGSLLHTLNNPTPANDAHFGNSVAVSGSTVVVGAHYDDTGATDAGSAYVFDAATGNLLCTLNNPTPAVGDNFGYSVAVSGNTVVVGTPCDDTGATDAGSAYVFDAANGNLLYTLNNPTLASYDLFGFSVAVSNYTVVVGAYQDDTGATDAGSAYVFDAANGNLLGTLANPTTAAWEGFGWSVAISGSTIAVGAPYDDTGANNTGSAYVFDAANGNLVHTINNLIPAAGDSFGYSVAVSGNTVVAGATYDDTGAIDAGSAYVFDAATGNLLRTLNKPTPPTGAYFGWSVAVSGNTVVVGAPYDDTGAAEAGSAYVFDAATGNLLWTLNNPNPAVSDYFGYSVAVSDSTVVVGAPSDNTGANNAGSAYVFDAATGNLLYTLNNPTPAPNDEFGKSVAISGNTVVVGAPYDSSDANSAGSAYVFDAATGNLLYTLNNPTPAFQDYFGWSVAISGSMVMVGAWGDDTGATDSGAVYVFDAATGNLLHTLNNPNQAAGAYFGRSVAVSGSTVVVGTPGDNTGASGAGSAYVFDAAIGNLLRTIVNPTSAADDYFGFSVAVSGSKAIVGAYGVDGSTQDRGAAYLFDVSPAESIAVGFGGSRGAWIWNSPGVWTPLHGLTPVWIVSGDRDGNGKVDLVANFGGTTGIWIYRDTGTWQYLHPANSTAAAMADIDGDNRAELILTTSQAGIAGVWAYDATLNTWTGLAGWQAEGFAVGDFDGNGKQDVAVDFGAGKGLWFWNNNTAWQYVHNVNPGWMAAGDLDGNGKTDLALSVTGANDIWARLDSGAWQFIKSMANSTATAADSNGDGRAELFVSITDPVYAGLWEYSIPASSWKYTTNWRPENLTSADVDGNGKMDLAVDFGSSGLWLWKNDAAWQCMHGLDAAVLAGAKQPAQAPQAAMSASARGELLLAMLDEFTTDALNAKRRVKL